MAAFDRKGVSKIWTRSGRAGLQIRSFVRFIVVAFDRKGSLKDLNEITPFRPKTRHHIDRCILRSPSKSMKRSSLETNSKNTARGREQPEDKRKTKEKRGDDRGEWPWRHASFTWGSAI